MSVPKRIIAGILNLDGEARAWCEEDNPVWAMLSDRNAYILASEYDRLKAERDRLRQALQECRDVLDRFQEGIDPECEHLVARPAIDSADRALAAGRNA